MIDTVRDQLQSALVRRYEIERELGKGGMATVYLARDVKHDRHVALKLLNPDLGAVVGAERFLSEIRVTANLQHPNLLPLFDSGSADGLLFYVMPYVQGESLRARLDRERQLPVDEAVRITTAIAGALDYAHKHGVIHRDLKPENILLQHGQPVVADFGIALAVSNAGGQRVTQTGLSLGTPQYMSPEQATGDRVIDARSDIYSLGAVAYEMLAGEPPHAGSTAQAIIARLMTEVPRSLTTVRHTIPPHVDDAVQCALEKLPADRFATAGEFADALGGGTSRVRTTHAARAARPAPVSRPLVAALVVATALALGLGAVLWKSRSAPKPGAVRFFLALPPNQELNVAVVPAVTLSPDGRTVVYRAGGTRSNVTGFFVRPLDSLNARLLADGNGIGPAFSPDGKWLAYMGGGIRKIPLSGGSPTLVTELTQWQGFAWGPKGDFVVSAGGSLWRVGDKGARTLLAAPDTAAGEISLSNPQFVSDKVVAFQVQKSSADGTPRGIGLIDVSGGEYAVLDIPGDAPVGYVNGHLLVGNIDGSLSAFPVDLGKRVVTGVPVRLLDSVVWTPQGGIHARLAADGSLAYVHGSPGRYLYLLDKRGSVVAQAPDARNFGGGSISPDGKRVVISASRTLVGGRNVSAYDLYVWDVEAKALSRLATTDGGNVPTWSGDGTRIYFLRRPRDRPTELWAVPVDGSTPEKLLARVSIGRLVPSYDISPDGRWMAITVVDSSGDRLYRLDLSRADATPERISRTSFDERAPKFSPDGRWLAYSSNETGRAETYVRLADGSGPAVKVSAGTGTTPFWTDGGRAVTYTLGGVRRATATLAVSGSTMRVVARDSSTVEGSRVDVDPRSGFSLVMRDPNDRKIVIVLNWIGEVRERLRKR